MMKYTVARLVLLNVTLFFAGCATAPKPEDAATVEAGKKEAAAAKAAAHLLPKIMLLVDEQSLGTIATAEVEAMGIQRLLDQNVPVVDQDMVRANIGKSQDILKRAGDNRGAAALGQQYGADIIIVGEAVAKPSARRIAESNLRTYQAVVTLRAVRTDNSSTIASSSQDQSVLGLDDVAGSSKAIKGAGEKCYNQLIPKVLSSWAKEPAGHAGSAGNVRVALTVGGVDQAWKLKEIREKLRDMKSQINNVVQRSYTTGLAEFDLDSLIPTEELAEAVVMNPPQGLKFQILEVNAGKISLRAATP